MSPELKKAVSRGGRGRANVTTDVLRKHGSDFSLPSPETPGIRRFSTETSKAFLEEGFVIYTLTGKTVQDLIDSGFGIDLFGYEAVAKMRSPVTEVAFFKNDPSWEFSEGSWDYIRHEITHRMVPRSGAELVIGNVADYIELADLHAKKTALRRGTSRYLFGPEFGSKSIWTSSVLGKDVVVLTPSSRAGKDFPNGSVRIKPEDPYHKAHLGNLPSYDVFPLYLPAETEVLDRLTVAANGIADLFEIDPERAIYILETIKNMRGLKISDSEIRKSLARSLHSDVGGSENEMKAVNTILDQNISF